MTKPKANITYARPKADVPERPGRRGSWWVGADRDEFRVRAAARAEELKAEQRVVLPRKHVVA